MQIREDYVLRKLGIGYMAIPVGQAGQEFQGVIRLNGTGAFLWQCILDGADTREKLIAAMLERYEGLDEATAGRDLDVFLAAIGRALV